MFLFLFARVTDTFITKFNSSNLLWEKRKSFLSFFFSFVYFNFKPYNIDFGIEYLVFLCISSLNSVYNGARLLFWFFLLDFPVHVQYIREEFKVFFFLFAFKKGNYQIILSVDCYTISNDILQRECWYVTNACAYLFVREKLCATILNFP